MKASAPATPPPQAATAPTPTLQLLGLDADAEAAYRAVLRTPHARPPAIARRLGTQTARLKTALLALQDRGLVAPSRQQDGGWVAAAPEVAVELLLMTRQAELNRARAVLPDLLRELKGASTDNDSRDVQIVPADSQAQLNAYLDMLSAARTVVANVICPPFVASAPDTMEAARAHARHRGVRMRTLVSPEMIRWPGWRTAAQQATAAGDEIRVADHLPFKMLLCDRNAGLVPLRKETPDGLALRLGPTAVLDVLWLLFDSLWANAVPALDALPDFGPKGTNGMSSAVPEVPDVLSLVTLLASGANDKKIAGILGISERTLLRRILSLTTHLQARSRFQGGWLAARRFASVLGEAPNADDHTDP